MQWPTEKEEKNKTLSLKIKEVIRSYKSKGEQYDWQRKGDTKTYNDLHTLHGLSKANPTTKPEVNAGAPHWEVVPTPQIYQLEETI